ncbi:MAG: hypothetical protein ACRBBK_11150 [Paracoccaceae bacterium]
MSPEEIEALFTRADGSFAFARWERPIVPVVFGVEEAVLPTIKGALEAVVAICGHSIGETDPEIGANFMLFFIREWEDLAGIPRLEEMIPGLEEKIATLAAAQATQYRAFRFEEAGGIQACFNFVRMDEAMAELPAEVIALNAAVQGALLWSDRAFAQTSPLAELPDEQGTIIRPEIANLLRAAYDRALPVAGRDPILALRLSARVNA